MSRARRRTSLACVYAGGDCVPGADLTVAAVQDGKIAALSRVASAQAMLADVDIIPPSLEDIYSRISRRDVYVPGVAA